MRVFKGIKIVFLTFFIFATMVLLAFSAYAISREEIRHRAQVWVAARVPYSQTNYRDGYRTDCSGFVSYAWRLQDRAGRPLSLTTRTLPEVSYPIRKDELQSGDILLNPDPPYNHVVIFDRWANDQRTEYWAYEMTPPKAVYRKIPYPYFRGYGTFTPYRYKELKELEDTDDERNISYGQTLNGTIDPAYDFDIYYFTGSQGDTVTIRLNKTTPSFDPYVELWKDGRLIKQDDDGGENRNSLLVATLPESGIYRIVARGYQASTGSYSLQLTKEGAHDPDDYRWIAYGQTLQGTINPSNDRDIYYFGGVSGRVISVRMNKIDPGLDSYLELWSPNGTLVATNDDSGGDNNSWLLAVLPSTGAYRIVARSFAYSSSGRYTLSVASVTSSNLALNKYAVASSAEFAGVEASKAVDENMGTRWSSCCTDPTWIFVDLGADYTIDQVVLKWSTAYAREYGILTMSSSQCCSNWQWAFYTTNGDGGVDTITFSPRAARWVLMYGIRKGTPWGYSLWEFEVYNTANTVIPIVPPDDPGKGDSGMFEEPLAPTAPDKEVEALSVGSGEDGQENAPLAGDPPEEIPLIDPSVTYQPPSATIDIITPTIAYQGIHLVYFAGSGRDGDENGENIIAYSWSSSLDGPIGVGYSSVFTWTADMLSIGTHIISMSVLDDEGIWSEPVTATLTIRPSSRLYLPLVLRNR
ncbi:MAG: discoidin domain-containing protein [Candidatus Caldarchaeum sp.]